MYSYKSFLMAIYSLITWTFIVCLFFNQSPVVIFLKLFPVFCFHKEWCDDHFFNGIFLYTLIIFLGIKSYNWMKVTDILKPFKCLLHSRIMVLFCNPTKSASSCFLKMYTLSCNNFYLELEGRGTCPENTS